MKKHKQWASVNNNINTQSLITRNIRLMLIILIIEETVCREMKANRTSVLSA